MDWRRLPIPDYVNRVRTRGVVIQLTRIKENWRRNQDDRLQDPMKRSRTNCSNAVDAEEEAV